MKKEMELAINPKDYGIEDKKATELMGGLPQVKTERLALEQKYNEILSMDIDDKETSKLAREIRLKVKDNRTKGIEVWHKTAKDFFLKGGQFVDAIKNVEVAVNKRMEDALEQIEKHFEIKEQQRKDALRDERIEALKEYSEFVPMGINLGDMSDDEYQKIFNGAKLQYEAKIEREKKEEAERLRVAAIENLKISRSQKLVPYYDFIGKKLEGVSLGEISDDEFSSILNGLISEKKAHIDEQERQRKEAEKLAKKLEEERKEAKEKLEQAEKERQKIEKELQEKKDKEAREEKERIEKEANDKKEAEKLAKAPIKKQLTAWVNSFDIPSTNVKSEVAEGISAKFKDFVEWAKKEVSKM